ncbi:MAG TPA: alanine--glyoxylate aminotransferase family protein [Gemmatimonadaceae bacterium]|nr:alanine--glyoxylate aminotransferase family protein [Gemmatimonadaceae bacterium]
MIESGRFFVPGPTEVSREILETLRRPMIFHRSADMHALMARVTKGLGGVFGTVRPVHVLTTSGTGAMEMAIRNGTVQRVLSVVHGDFGERFAKMAEACGRTVTRLTAVPGQVVPLDAIHDALRRERFDAVTVTQNETATGVFVDVAPIAAIVREHDDCLLLVDAVSSAAGAPIATDAWPADCVVSASQKSFALPPGLAFAAVSERFVERAKSVSGRGVYLDVVRFEEFASKLESPTTPAVSLFFALDAQLQAIERETLRARFARHAAMRDVCVAWVQEADTRGLGVSLVASDGYRSPTVTCIAIADNAPLLRTMRERGYELGGGQKPLAKTSFRIGHMGDHTVAGVRALLPVLEQALR